MENLNWRSLILALGNCSHVQDIRLRSAQIMQPVSGNMGFILLVVLKAIIELVLLDIVSLACHMVLYP